MSVTKPASTEVDPVLDAFDRAPLDDGAVTAEEARDLDAQIASAKARLAAGERQYKGAAELIAELEAIAKQAE